MLRFFTRVAPVLVAGGACLLLSACGGNDLARTMGFVRDAPDEFTVTTQAPLSMPPDFALRPPRPGAPRPQDRSTTADTGLSPGQQALIAQAGPAPANVAAQVDKQAELTKPSPGFIDRLMFWRSPAQPGDVVDAQQEAERLRKNAALGQSPATGPTPIIQSKPKGLLEGLF